MSGKESKRRATGPEKSQERPTHTSLTTLKEQVQNMQEQQSSDINNADTDDDGDNIPDYIDADPLNAAINAERLLPLGSDYKGSAIQEHQSAQ